jgi:hypothetical protein
MHTSASSCFVEQPIIAVMGGGYDFQVLNVAVRVWFSPGEIAFFAPLAYTMVVIDGEKLLDLAAIIAGLQELEYDAFCFIEPLLPTTSVGCFLLREWFLWYGFPPG